MFRYAYKFSFPDIRILGISITSTTRTIDTTDTMARTIDTGDTILRSTE